MNISEAIQVLQKEQEWYYQTNGKGVMVNNESLHRAINIVLDELDKPTKDYEQIIKNRIIPDFASDWNNTDEPLISDNFIHEYLTKEL